jgi:MFS family permease
VTRRPLLVLTFLAAYLLSYFFRSTNAVLADDLQRDAGLGPEQLGLMTSLFFLVFAAAQLPLGAALDRWGPRWVPAGLMLATVVGSLVTATSDGFAGLALGRALIGLGMAGVLMGALKAFAAWFPPQRFATVSGLFVGVGSLGALGATTPLAALADGVGWRGVFVGAAAATGVVALALTLVVRAAPPAGAAGPPPGGAGRGGPTTYRTIFASGAFWRLALLVFALNGGLYAHQGLWGGPFLTEGLGLPLTTAAGLLLVLGLAATTGFLTAGPAASRVGLRPVMAAGALLALLALVALASVPPGTPPALLAVAWAAYGLGAGSTVLGYAAGRELFPGAPGRAVTAVNLFGIGGSALLQAGLGLVVAGVAAALGAADAPPLAAYRATLWTAAGLLAAALAGFTLLGRSGSSTAASGPG